MFIFLIFFSVPDYELFRSLNACYNYPREINFNGFLLRITVKGFSISPFSYMDT